MCWPKAAAGVSALSLVFNCSACNWFTASRQNQHFSLVTPRDEIFSRFSCLIYRMFAGNSIMLAACSVNTCFYMHVVVTCLYTLQIAANAV